MAVLRSDPTLLASLGPTVAPDYELMAVVQYVEGWERFRDAVLPGLRAFDPAALERNSGKYSLCVEHEVRSPKCDVPTLIITRCQDHVVGYQDQIVIPGLYLRASIVVFDKAGRNAHLDQPKMIDGYSPSALNSGGFARSV